MQSYRYTALIPPELMQKARRLGLSNFSGFVKQSLVEYCENRENISKCQGLPPSKAPDSASHGGRV